MGKGPELSYQPQNFCLRPAENQCSWVRATLPGDSCDKYHIRSAHNLPALKPGDTVGMKPFTHGINLRRLDKVQSSGSTYRCNRQHLDTAPDLDKTAELPETNIRKELPIHLSSQAPTSKTRSEGNQLQPSPKKLHSVESRSTPSPGQSSPKAHHSEESCTRTTPFENQRSEAVLYDTTLKLCHHF